MQFIDWLQNQLLGSVVKDLAQLNHRITQLEARMSAVDDKIALLDTATNDIAAELETLRGQIAAEDADTAAKLDPIITRLQGLAADPNNPVPT
ncbi:MAG: hypothetical protein ACRDQZ_24030, partial [Mycobacteriales bacterium]